MNETVPLPPARGATTALRETPSSAPLGVVGVVGVVVLVAGLPVVGAVLPDVAPVVGVVRGAVDVGPPPVEAPASVVGGGVDADPVWAAGVVPGVTGGASDRMSSRTTHRRLRSRRLRSRRPRCRRLRSRRPTSRSAAACGAAATRTASSLGSVALGPGRPVARAARRGHRRHDGRQWIRRSLRSCPGRWLRCRSPRLPDTAGSGCSATSRAPVDPAPPVPVPDAPAPVLP